MKRITQYAQCFLVNTIICTAVFAAVLIFRPSNWELHAVLALSVVLISAFFFGVVKKKLESAKLIVENQILYIQPAIIREQNSKKENEIQPCETVDMFVSCFGILLGSKIIKFNQNGIRLKAVEIGRNYLSLDYGNNAYNQNIRLLHARPDSNALAGIIEKFHYETGIVPTITN